MNARLQEIENGWPGEASPGLGLRHAENSFDDQKWAEALLAGEKRVLEMIARGKSLPSILDALCRLIEQMSSGSFCSIWLLDEGGEHLRHGAAPSLPTSYTERINGHAISSCWGPCGIAAYRKEQVVICDVATDPVRPEYRDLALAHGLRACWSTPILSSEGRVLGTFAIYSQSRRNPTVRQRNLIEQFAHLGSIAIERTRNEEALRRSQAYLAEAQKLSRTGSFGWKVSSGELVWSDETFRIMGYHLGTKPTLERVLERVHPEDIAVVKRAIECASREGTNLDFEHRLLLPDGKVKYVQVVARATTDEPGESEFVGAVMDVTEQKRAEKLRVGENRLLEMIAQGSSLDAVLEALCRFFEEISTGSIASILLLDAKDNCLRQAVGPNLPQAYVELINTLGVAVGPCAGSCGTAVYRKELVIVSDINTDPLWAKYRDLVAPFGLRACWSMPILSSEGGVLGTFAIYSHDKRCPAPQDYKVIEQVSHLASVAIERKHAENALRRSEAALRASEQLARGQVTALTRTLDALAMESAPDRLVEHVLRTITEQLDAHSSSVWRKEDASSLVSFEFAFEKNRLVTRSDAAIAKISPTLNVEDVWPWPEVFRTGKPSVMEDIRKGPSFPWREHVLALGVVTILVVPMLIAGRVEGVIGIRFTRKRSFRAEELELAQALAHQAMLAIQLRRLSRQSRQAAVAAERNRLARDIHDTLAQGLTGVIVQLEAGEDALSKGLTLEAGNHLEQAGTLARESLHEARRSVQALRPQSLEEKELPGALADLFRKMTTGTNISADFVQRGESRKLPRDWEENLLRIGQEVLTNALRHSQATEFKAALVFEPEAIRFDMHDNGRGFDPGNRHDGFGLLGISERVEGMGGQFKIESRPGEGTGILISLPFSAEHQGQK